MIQILKYIHSIVYLLVFPNILLVSTMQAFKSKIETLLKPKHFLTYSFSYLAFGSIISGVGPLVPYMSEKTGFNETQYAFIYFCRSMGFIFGAFILRFVEKKLTFHQILLISSVFLLALTSTFCFVLDLTLQGITMFFISVFCCFLEITINLSVLETQKNGEVEFWMLVCHGFFGIGGLCGPILVYFFEINSYAVMGTIAIISAPLYYFLESPEKHEDVIERLSKEGYLDQMKNAGHEISFITHSHNEERKFVGSPIVCIISLLMFLYVGLEIGFSSWVSSYAVIENIATKESATKYSSLFWVVFTCSGFATPFIPLKPMKKLLMFIYSFFSVGIITLVLIFLGFKNFACLFSASTFGICLSSLFPLLLAIPNDYNLEVSPSQGATLMLWMSLGEGTLATLTGYLMEWFGNAMLFLSMTIMGLGFMISAHFLKAFYEKQAKQNYMQLGINSEQELTQIMVKKN